MAEIKWCYLGSTNYDVALKLMEHLRQEVVANPEVQYLLFLQHPPVITQGYADKGDSGLKVGREELADMGISVVSTDRGGKTAFHGPGQLVGYTVFQLEKLGLKIKQFVHLLEEVIIQLLDSYGLVGIRRPGEPGVWIGESKVAFLGIRVKDQIVTHGFAINVNIDLAPFRNILACGLEADRVTSMRDAAGNDFSFFDVYWRLVLFLGDQLGVPLEEVYLDEVDWLQ